VPKETHFKKVEGVKARTTGFLKSHHKTISTIAVNSDGRVRNCVESKKGKI